MGRKWYCCMVVATRESAEKYRGELKENGFHPRIYRRYRTALTFGVYLKKEEFLLSRAKLRDKEKSSF